MEDSTVQDLLDFILLDSIPDDGEWGWRRLTLKDRVLFMRAKEDYREDWVV